MAWSWGIYHRRGLRWVYALPPPEPRASALYSCPLVLQSIWGSVILYASIYRLILDYEKAADVYNDES